MHKFFLSTSVKSIPCELLTELEDFFSKNCALFFFFFFLNSQLTNYASFIQLETPMFRSVIFSNKKKHTHTREIINTWKEL